MQTWFITNAGNSFGRALTEKLLARGYVVAATFSTTEERFDYELRFAARTLCYVLDVTDANAVRDTIDEVEAVSRGIDVVVNNDGHHYQGMIEEASLDDIRQQFEVNVFGAVSVVQAVLPYFRQRKKGRIFNVTSMAGLLPGAGLGIYHGSKFAMEGITEALAHEVAPLGIHVTAVAPGLFRNEATSQRKVRVGRRIADYHTPGRQIVPAASKQPHIDGDPARAAQALLLVASTKRQPRHLLLGAEVLNSVRRRIGDLQEELSDWESVSLNTDFQPSF